MNEPNKQLQLFWPESQDVASAGSGLPPGYILRPYQPGDETQFYAIMARAGWSGWDDRVLGPWKERLFPGGWVMIIHQPSGELASSAMALKSNTYPNAGEFGWLVGNTRHLGIGLDFAVAAAVTAHFLSVGCCRIHLFTEHWRLAAIKIYLKLGYRPYLYAPEMTRSWRQVCEQLNWPIQPGEWKKGWINAS